MPGTDAILGQLHGVTGLTDGLLGSVGGADASLGGALNVGGLHDLATGNINVSSHDTVGQVEHATGNVLGTATGVTDTATGLVGSTAGVGNVLGDVTHVAGGDLPVVERPGPRRPARLIFRTALRTGPVPLRTGPVLVSVRPPGEERHRCADRRHLTRSEPVLRPRLSPKGVNTALCVR